MPPADPATSEGVTKVFLLVLPAGALGQ